jgi:hypothetical protein
VDITPTMRALRQTFVLTPATVVAVDWSVKQATTNFTYAIKSSNSYVQYISSRVINYQYVSIVLFSSEGLLYKRTMNTKICHI